MSAQKRQEWSNEEAKGDPEPDRKTQNETEELRKHGRDVHAIKGVQIPDTNTNQGAKESSYNRTSGERN